MHRIGIINYSGDDEELKKIQGSIPDNWELLSTTLNEQHMFNVLILIENGIEHVGEICGQLLQLRSQTDSLIWVKSHFLNSQNRKTYLTLGADGVITELLEDEEWFLIINNALKREKSTVGVESEQKGLFKMMLDTRNRSLIIKDKGEVLLTKIEYKTFSLLMENMGRTVTYEDIFVNVWGDEQERKLYRINNIIFHIRLKLERVLGHSKPLRTVRSTGYVLEESEIW